MPLVAPFSSSASSSNTDGTLIIDTRLDPTGFEFGITRVRRSMDKLKNSIGDTFAKSSDAVYRGLYGIRDAVGKFGSFVGGTFKKLLVGALLLFALSFRKIVQSVRESMGELIAQRGGKLQEDVEEIKFKFVELRASIAAAFLPLLEMAIPYIKMALDWLIQLINYIAMVTAAFMGQKEVLQVIPGSAKKLADQTKKTEKAAKGALAAFDQINVLQKDMAKDKETTAPTVETRMVPVTDDILKKVQDIKTLWDAIWDWTLIQAAWEKLVAWFRENFIEPIKAWWNDLWSGSVFEALWNNFVDTWRRIWENTVMTFQSIKEHILQVFTGIGEFLRGVFTGDWTLIWQGLKNIVNGTFGLIQDFIKGTLTNILIFFGGWGEQIRIVFGSALEWVKQRFITIFEGIKNFVKGVINSIIDFINGMVQGIVDAINTVIGLANAVSADWPGFQPHSLQQLPPKIPRLATGAVVPAHANMLAMIGEGSQTEIVAPEDMIRQIIREEMGSGEVNAPIVLTLDGEVVYRNQQRIQTRRGKSLLAGGTV